MARPPSSCAAVRCSAVLSGPRLSGFPPRLPAGRAVPVASRHLPVSQHLDSGLFRKEQDIAADTGQGTLVFLQGTGPTDGAVAEQLRAGLAGEPRLARFRLQVLDWTRIAPPDLPAAPALPEEEPAASGPAAGLGPAAAAADAAADLAAELGAAAGQLAGDALLGLLTGVAVRHRAALTDAAGDFARNIGFYLAQGARVRELVRADLADTAPGRPVILYGHSLGGAAAVDLLRESDAAGLGVDLLVTAGSQAPWLALLGLAVPGAVPAAPPAPAPSAPWLNLWDRRDLLAFCAERVWPAAVRTHPVRDVELSSGQPFPQSHGSYFRSAEGFRAVADALFPGSA